VVAVDSFGNQSTFSNIVCVDNCSDYNLPNAFTPNGDGFNDLFTPILPYRFIDRVDMKIFDRWGNLLWRSDGLTAGDENAGWDGTFRGEPMNPAVFVWWAEIEFIDGLKEIYFGDVTVVR
ncbi:MAG: T9SS type B sorting domain-containing protein, partial [Bacteroidota bacterium]